MCSIEQIIPYVALAVFSASDWETMLRGSIRKKLGLAPAESGESAARVDADASGGTGRV
jgi:hypothetical protein